MKSKILTQYLDKNICIILKGSSGAMAGKLLSIDAFEDYLVMDTRWSSKQYFSMSDIQSFWSSEDKLID